MPITWCVEYFDGTIEKGIDLLSKQAFNNSNIKLFYLFTDYFTSLINLEYGTITFSINNDSFFSEFSIHSSYEKEKYRLIYFKKKEVTISEKAVGEEISDIPHIGWQITKDGVNIKRIFKITDRITLEE